MSRIIREAKPTDMAAIMQVIDAAKMIMRQSGNMHQWGDGYPSESVISADIEKNGGFVIEEANKLVAYFAFLPSPEPTYSKIYDGNWLDDEKPYHVVHRIASLPDVHGIFSSIMDFSFAYDLDMTISEKLNAIATKIYHADGVEILPAAKKQMKQLTELGYGNFPICMAKTQYSFSDDAKLLGAPEHFKITIRNLKVSAGAGFLVALCGDIMTMPGLPKVPAAEKIDVDENGKISGLF